MEGPAGPSLAGRRGSRGDHSEGPPLRAFGFFPRARKETPRRRGGLREGRQSESNGIGPVSAHHPSWHFRQSYSSLRSLSHPASRAASSLREKALARGGDGRAKKAASAGAEGLIQACAEGGDVGFLVVDGDDDGQGRRSSLFHGAEKGSTRAGAWQ